MDFDPGASNPKPRRLHHHSTNIGTQPHTASSQSKHIMPKDTSFAESPPSFNRLSASVRAASSTHQASTAAYRLRNGSSTTTRRSSSVALACRMQVLDHPNNNSLYNRQLDFTLSPPLDRTSWSKVPQRRPHARNRIFDSNW